MNPTRQAAIAAGLPHTVPTSSVSMVCGSGMKAIAAAFTNLKQGNGSIVVAGGMENMSLV